MTVYIAYGWPEGKWHGKKLRRALNDFNYQVVKLPEEADIIIAHSTGCYMLPPKVKAKLILLIGLPNWPNRSHIKRTRSKVGLEAKDWQWLQKTFWHVIYALFQPVRLYNVYKAYKIRCVPMYESTQVILVRNEQDTYMEKGVSEKLAKERNWSYQNLKGQHDDVWEDPLVYTEIINKSLHQ